MNVFHANSKRLSPAILPIFLAVLVLMPQLAKADHHTFLKCNGAKHGTLWASFGRWMTSESPEIKLFATEWALFYDGKASRRVYLNWKESVESVEVVYGPKKFKMVFQENTAAGVRKHTLTLLKFIPESPNSYQGNWKVEQEGLEQTDDLAMCTIM